MSAHPEIERKYDVGIETVVPDLHGIKSISQVSGPELTHPSSTYFDTADLALARSNVTLRRRTGSDDAGWHVKVPVAADERLEYRTPLSSGGNDSHVPDEVAHRVRSLVRGAPLIPVAHIETRRQVTKLGTSDRAHAAELCDDSVTARNFLDDVTTKWREWEVELVDGDRSLLKKVDAYLLAHGAESASSSSKLGRALGSLVPQARTAVPAPGKKASAGELLAYAIDADVRRLHAADPAVRTDDDDAVHSMRVAVRRLRSVLRSYRALLDREPIDVLRGELKWLADILGTARDAEVLAERYRSGIDHLDRALVRGDAADRLVQSQRRIYELAHAEILVTLDGDRYFALLDTLDRLVDDPPFTARASKSAVSVADHAIRKQYDALGQLDADTFTDATDDDALHEIRKAAKKLRYAAEPAEAVLGSRARRIAKAAKNLQSALGDHHDSAVSRGNILTEAAAAHEHGEDTFTYGVLHQRERSEGAQALAAAPSAWSKLEKRAKSF